MLTDRGTRRECVPGFEARNVSVVGIAERDEFDFHPSPFFRQAEHTDQFELMARQ